MLSASQTVLRPACPMRLSHLNQSVPCQRCIRMQAEDQKGGIDFTPRTSKETGYLKEDSAGQENIFAVESKAFTAGSSQDSAPSGANAAVAGVAVAVGALVIVGGILFTKNSTVAPDVPVPNVLDDLPTESLSSISKRLVPAEVKEAVQEAPAVAKDVAEQAADALPQ